MYPYRYCILLYDALINLKVPAPRVLSLSSSLSLFRILEAKLLVKFSHLATPTAGIKTVPWRELL